MPLLAWAGLSLGQPASSSLASPPASPPELPAYNTYEVPPFVQESAQGAPAGLAADVVKALNRRLVGAYRFKLVNLPRRRLVEVHLRDPATFEGIALFLAPQFLDEALSRRLLWSLPLFEEQNVLVFRAGATKRRIERFEHLAGLRLGGVLGNRYGPIDEMVAAGRVSRDNAVSPLASLNKLCLGRVDFTQMSRLTLQGLKPLTDCPAALEELPVPPPQGGFFARRLFTGPGNTVLAAKLDAVLRELPCDVQWRAMLQSYGVPPGVCAAGAADKAP